MDQIYDYAWFAVTVEPETLRNPQTALPYALKPVEMSHSSNPQCLHVLAETYSRTGHVKAAIASEERALARYPPVPPAPHNQAPPSAIGTL
jgi:hypothetical protein